MRWDVRSPNGNDLVKTDEQKHRTHRAGQKHLVDSTESMKHIENGLGVSKYQILDDDNGSVADLVEQYDIIL